MITIKVKKINIPDKYKNMGKTLRPFVNKYLYEKIDGSLKRAINVIRDNYVYKKLTRDTGKLGRSMTPTKRMINQYSMEFGLYFDEKIAPHAATQIPENDRGMSVIRAKGKRLTVPIRGGPADVRGKRLVARDMGLTARNGVLYKKETPYFTLRTSVLIPQRVYTGTILQYLMEPSMGDMQGNINRIASRAIKEAKSRGII